MFGTFDECENVQLLSVNSVNDKTKVLAAHPQVFNSVLVACFTVPSLFDYV